MSEYYSQHGEDEALSRIFGSKIGVCVEVGAHDGVKLSNSYHFEELGWRCILVEANPTLCREIRRSRGHRTTLFPCAASSADGVAIMSVGSGSDDVYSSLELLSEKASDRGFAEIEVPTRTLDSMLEEAGVGPVDFISIDIEGHEIHALRGLDLTRWKPRIVLLEDSKDLRDSAVRDHMRDRGYCRFYRSGTNDWYIRSDDHRMILLGRLLFLGKFDWRGFFKISLPQWIIWPALDIHRTIIGR